MDLFKKCETIVNTVEQAQAIGIYPYFTPIQSMQDHRVIIDGAEFIMIGSNGYLGLAADPRMREVVVDAVKKYGSTCSGSRFLNGTLDIHVRLEEELAEFFEKNGAIVFSIWALSPRSPARMMLLLSTGRITPRSLTDAGYLLRK
jgi:8-amino-7-oxononanoate synthase